MAELLNRPKERANTHASRTGGRGCCRIAGPRRSQDANGVKRPRRKAKPVVPGERIFGKHGVGLVEKEEVFALDVEDDRFCPPGFVTQHARVEQREEQKGRVTGLGGNTRDAADVDMCSLGAIDKIEVQEHRLTTAA